MDEKNRPEPDPSRHRADVKADHERHSAELNGPFNHRKIVYEQDFLWG
jgi:hypothetical protein